MLNIFKFFHVEDADPGGTGRPGCGAAGFRRDSRRIFRILSVVIATAMMSPGWGPMQAMVMAAEPAQAIEQGRPTKRDRRQLADWNRWSASAEPDEP